MFLLSRDGILIDWSGGREKLFAPPEFFLNKHVSEVLPPHVAKVTVENLAKLIETGEMHEDAAGNFRALDHLVMKGDEVFNFVQREVPPMIEQLLSAAGCSKEDVDYYMFHQPNKFMLNKLADKLGVPREKMPSNIVENFGNASGVSIPTAVSYNLGAELTQSTVPPPIRMDASMPFPDHQILSPLGPHTLLVIKLCPADDTLFRLGDLGSSCLN